MKRVIISGYFNPLHRGHIAYIKAARDIGDHLTVIINSDYQVGLKGSVPFMDEDERMEIVKSIRWVDEVMLSIDQDRSQCKSLEYLRDLYKGDEIIFANGGDRTSENIPEMKVSGVKFVFGVGGTEKLQSSSELIGKTKDKGAK